MSTGRPPIALGLIDDDHQAKCMKLRRKLTDQQCAAFERFLSFRSVHLLTWLYRCFPALEGQLQRGALPAIMRCDPVIKLSPASISRGLLFDKRRLWVCTDTHLFVFREDGALKVQVKIADIAEVIHVRVAVPVPRTQQQPRPTHHHAKHPRSESSVFSGDEDDDTSRFNDNDENALDPSELFEAHRPTAVCHAVVLRSPGKRDVGAFFGPSALSANLVIQYVLNRRRVAIVNHAVRTGSTILPPAAAQEAIVTRPVGPHGGAMDAVQLTQYLTGRGIFLKRPAGSATSVTMSAPSVPLITASASSIAEVTVGSSVYHEALREVESNATRCREETADATCNLLMASHFQYSALLRKALSTQHKTDVIATKLRQLRETNSERQAIAAEKLQSTRAEIQRFATEMLAMSSMHAKSVAELRETCLSSEDRSKQSLTTTHDDDQRTGQMLQQLTNEAFYLEDEIHKQSEKLEVLRSSLPSESVVDDEISQLQDTIAQIRQQRAASENALQAFTEDTVLRTGLVMTPRIGGGGGGEGSARRSHRFVDPSQTSSFASANNADSMDGDNSPARSLSLSAAVSPLRSAASFTDYATPSVAQQEEVRMLEEQAMEALERKRQALEFMSKARIAHGNESIVLERKRIACEKLADAVTAAAKREKEAKDAAIQLRIEVDRLSRRIRQLPLESLLCDDLKRAQIIEASVERSVRQGASPAGLKRGEEVLQMQLSHLNSIRDRMQGAITRIASPSSVAENGAEWGSNSRPFDDL